MELSILLWLLLCTGRVNILMKILIPEDMDLVEPLDKSCIWCQARGTAMEVSGAESKADSTEKVLFPICSSF